MYTVEDSIDALWNSLIEVATTLGRINACWEERYRKQSLLLKFIWTISFLKFGLIVYLLLLLDKGG